MELKKVAMTLSMVGTVRYPNEVEEDFEAMGLEKSCLPEDFSVTEVLTGADDDWDDLVDDDGEIVLDREPDEKIEFDYNRIAKIWKEPGFWLYWFSSDGKAEEGLYLVSLEE